PAPRQPIEPTRSYRKTRQHSAISLNTRKAPSIPKFFPSYSPQFLLRILVLHPTCLGQRTVASIPTVRRKGSASIEVEEQQTFNRKEGVTPCQRQRPLCRSVAVSFSFRLFP